MYQSELKGVVFCATSVLGISWKHLKHPNLLVLRIVGCAYVYFYVPIILHHLGIPFSNEDVLARLKILILKAHITVFEMIMALMGMKYG